MEPKLTALGAMIYVAMGLWAAALGASLSRRPRQGNWLFAGGCAVLVAAFVVRWIELEHVPLQNMFDVILVMGMVWYPLGLFTAWIVGDDDPRVLAALRVVVLILGEVILVPAGFVFPAELKPLPPALQSWLFIPHVSAYMLSYVILMLGAALAAMRLAFGAPAKGPDRLESATFRMIRLGFPLLTVGLMLGAAWGKLAWGDYWNWDPKELLSLATFLVYLAYFHVRSQYGPRLATLHSVLALAGFLAVLATLLWVNLSRLFAAGMHSYASS
jgi:ABC-type transport system involved in cytochrome c biogenesis permease subunit